MRETVLPGFASPPPNASGHGYILSTALTNFNYVRLRAPAGAVNTFLGRTFVYMSGIAGDCLVSRSSFNPVDTTAQSQFLDQRRTVTSTQASVHTGTRNTVDIDSDGSIRIGVPREGRFIDIPYIFQNSNSVYVIVMQSAPLFVSFLWFEE